MPRFQWTLSAPETDRNRAQSAFQLRILDASGTQIFDTRRQTSPFMHFRPAAPIGLKSQSTYTWHLTIWDERGVIVPEVQAGAFCTGLISKSDNRARWISAERVDIRDVKNTDGQDPALSKPKILPIFRKAFQAPETPAIAHLMIAGLGQYQLFVNGIALTADGLNGAWTDCKKNVLYDSYDISSALRVGENWLGIALGNGFFNAEDVESRYHKLTRSEGPPQLWAQLKVIYSNGAEAIIGSDATWQWHASATTFSSIYGGEDYDSRRNVEGWSEGKGAAEDWRSAFEISGPKGVLRSHGMRSMRGLKRLNPVAITEPKPQVLVYDFGLNHSGRPILTADGIQPGTKITLRPGELLLDDGTIDQGSMTGGRPGLDGIEFNYICAGKSEETWQPGFTYTGYRYLQVEGAKPTGLSSQFLSDDFADVGEITCADKTVERIHALIKQAVLCNLASVLTDCPTREKLGWLEQTYLNSDTVLMNSDAIALYEKMAADIVGAQLGNGLVPSIAPEYAAFVDSTGKSTDFRDSPEWGAAVVLSPWAAYRLYGDIEILRTAYPAMQAYADYLQVRTGPDGLLDYGLGDWYDFGPARPGRSQLTSRAFTATATFYDLMQTLSRVANILEMTHAKVYVDAALGIKSSLLKAFFDPATGRFDTGSQCAQSMALTLNLPPQAERKAVLDVLVADIKANGMHVSAGDIGFHYVVRALNDEARGDILLAMLQKRGKPSYADQLSHGATALTEAWDADRSESQNHFMLGHIEAWLYRGLGGISVDFGPDAEAAIVIAPQMTCGAGAAGARYSSILGAISCNWRLEGQIFSLNAKIPAGAKALIRLPVVKHLTETGIGLSHSEGIIRTEFSRRGINLWVGSGSYQFHGQIIEQT